MTTCPTSPTSDSATNKKTWTAPLVQRLGATDGTMGAGSGGLNEFTGCKTGPKNLSSAKQCAAAAT